MTSRGVVVRQQAAIEVTGSDLFAYYLLDGNAVTKLDLRAWSNPRAGAAT